MNAIENTYRKWRCESRPNFSSRRRRININPILVALLVATASPVSAGVAEIDTGASKNPVVPEKKPEANPLCFADGTICIDIQERFRFEARDNTFDFDSSVDSLTDGRHQ